MNHFDLPNQITMDGSTRQQRLYDDSIELLKIAEPPEGYYQTTSFGKDSIVAQRLCDEAGVRYESHHNVTGIDPPELIYFGRKHYPNTIRHMYSKSMWQLIVEKGIPPMWHMRYCCDVLKEGCGIGRSCVMGLRASESSRRRKTWGVVTQWHTKRNRHAIRMLDNDDVRNTMQACNAQGKLIISPQYHWNDMDLWAFIKDRNLPYCELYDEGVHRLGCIGCPMAREHARRHELERWPKFKAAYIRTFDRLIQNGRLQKTGVKSGEDLMEWWLQDRQQASPVEGQITIDDI